MTELESQRKLLDFQVEANKARRKEPARLPSEVVFRARLAGEAKGAYVITVVETKTMLRKAGFKHPEDLPLHLVDVYTDLHNTEEDYRAKARRLFVEANVSIFSMVYSIENERLLSLAVSLFVLAHLLSLNRTNVPLMTLCLDAL